MKSLQLLFLVLLTNPLVQGQDLDVHHYTVAKSGLNVRVMPKLGMPKVTTLSYLTEVKIIAETGVELSIQDEGKTLSGQWIEIQFKDENYRTKSGFVFDQFVKSISFGTSAPKGTLQIAHLSKAHFDFDLLCILSMLAVRWSSQPAHSDNIDSPAVRDPEASKRTSRATT